MIYELLCFLFAFMKISTDIIIVILITDMYWEFTNVTFIFFSIAKIHVSYWILHSYLTGVAAAAVTPVKYECDAKNLTGTLIGSKIFAYGEINERSFSNPHLCSGASVTYLNWTEQGDRRW